MPAPFLTTTRLNVGGKITEANWAMGIIAIGAITQMKWVIT